MDWTGTLWLAALPALATVIVPAGSAKPRLIAAWKATAALLLALYAVGFYHLAWGLHGLGYSTHIELFPVGWRELSRQVITQADRARAPSGQPLLIVGMDRYAIASELTFYAPDLSRALCRTTSGQLFGQVGLMYERWFPPGSLQGRDLLIVGYSADDVADFKIAAHVGNLGPIEEGVLVHHGTPVRHYFYRFASAYKGS